jgi:hypothetical protein
MTAVTPLDLTGGLGGTRWLRRSIKIEQGESSQCAKITVHKITIIVTLSEEQE